MKIKQEHYEMLEKELIDNLKENNLTFQNLKTKE